MSRKKTKKNQLDYLMLFSILGLLIIGLLMVYSSSYYSFAYENNDPNALLKKELAFSIVGLMVMYLASRIDTKTIRALAVPINVVTVLMYLALLTPLGWRFRGGLRWIRIAEQTIMPSEFAKYAVVIAAAYVLTTKKDEKRTPAYYFLIFCQGFYILATYLQPDMSSSIIIAVAVLAVLFFGGLNSIYIVMMSFLGVGAAVMAIILSPFRLERVKVLLNPLSDSSGKGFQVLQSLYAVASGSMLGKGLGNGIQKMMYLPLAYNDYIFSIYAEELGFAGCIILLAILSTLVLRGFKISANASDKFSVLLAGGIIAQIAVQSIMNMYVSISLFPSTGIPFPIISYGGTSLITTLGGLGLVLGISRQENKRTPAAFERIEKKKYHSLERRTKI